MKKITIYGKCFCLIFILILSGCAIYKHQKIMWDPIEVDTISTWDAKKLLLELSARKKHGYVKKLKDNLLTIKHSKNNDFIIFLGNEKTGIFSYYNVLFVAKNSDDRPMSIEIFKDQITKKGQKYRLDYYVILDNMRICEGIIKGKPKITDTEFELTWDMGWQDAKRYCREHFRFEDETEATDFLIAILSLFPDIKIKQLS